MDNNIIEKMRREIVNRSDLFEEQMKGTKDEYNLYREHVQYVYKYAVMLAKDADVDKEVVELSALLHDINRTYLIRSGIFETMLIMSSNKTYGK